MTCDQERGLARRDDSDYKAYQTEYRRTHRVVKPPRTKLTEEERKQRNKEADRRFRQTPKRKAYRREWAADRYALDEQHMVVERLRSRLRKAVDDYGAGSAIKPSQHNIPWQAIVEALGSCPGPRDEWDIGHKEPCCAFDHTDAEQVLRCWSVDNLEWQLRSENRQRSGQDRERSIRKQK